MLVLHVKGKGVILYRSTAKEVEAIVRAQGSTPATVGVLNGRVHVGLSKEDLDFLSRGSGLLKVSRQDLAYAVSKVSPSSVSS